ncbi:fas apoptotic inhibitory molecule 1 [Dermacentor andersoni]|uniref:fas apoptotic inhibitory molecule 1 n=1 Tax=Dermacentor andersoni TaxID=34620 RepID=UPI002155ADDE|nr:fas apoptotic inhibitory molecule 1-like [Dermacentor andersoni]
MADTVAVWEVPFSDKIHKIEFEHGTTTGRRIIKVDGKEILRRDWMFKLVGSEPFEVGRAKCVVTIRALSGFTYEYSLIVDGKQLDKFRERQSKILNTWIVNLLEQPARVVLEKDTLDIYVNGEKVDVVPEFVDGGTETHFQVGPYQAYITAASSGSKKEGILHTLVVEGHEIPSCTE